TQMPTLAKMPFMMIELAAYGIICGVLYRAARLDRFKFGIYPALIGGMLGGRAVYALALTVATYLLRLEAGTYIAVVNAVVTGAVGIVIQLVFVPPLVVSLEKMTRFTR
ncbi:MAG: hypothetical protein IJY04_07755, partial [Clostridia bacterium]|nr:hypothetical protein [Clostridia bacterium]